MSRQASVIEVSRVQQIAQRRCEDANVRIKWKASAQTAMTDGQTITLPVIHQPITTEQLDKLYGYVVHECGHHARPEAFEILKAGKPNDAIAAMYNIAEDDGMEREIAQRYRGDAHALGVQNKLMLQEAIEIYKKALAMKTDVSMTDAEVAPVSVCMLNQLSRSVWDSTHIGLLKEFLDTSHPDALRLFNELVKEGWVDKLRETKNPHDTWDLAIDLYKRIYPPSNEQNEQAIEQCRQDGHSKKEDKGDKDGKQDGNLGPPGTETERSPNPSSASAKKTGAPPKEGSVVSWKDAVFSEHKEWQPRNGPPGTIGITWDGYAGGKTVLAPIDNIKVIDLKKEQARRVNANYVAHDKSVQMLGNKMRRYLQAKKRIIHDPEKLHGRLDKRGIVRLMMPPIDGGQWNRKIFYDFREGTTKDTAIMVLTDWSGSMSGHKMEYAADASGRLVLICDRVLHMPVQLAAFSNGSSFCDIGLIKRFSERSVNAQELGRRFSCFDPWSSANDDADAVNWAYHEILKRPESRKLLLVLSDGAPAGSYAGSCSDSNLKYLTKQIDKDKRVELYGIGICSDAVKRYYSNCKVLWNTDQIGPTIFSIIKEGDNSGTKQRDGT